jgi:hypothetical protein
MASVINRGLVVAATVGFLLPIAAFAARDAAVTETSDAELQIEDLLNGMTGGDNKMMAPGAGGSMTYPVTPPSSTVTVDVSVTQEVTPDLVNVGGYCSTTSPVSQEEARRQMNALYQLIKQEVGADGRVRRTGGFSVMPYYDPVTSGTSSDKYTGSINITVRVVKMSAAHRITEILENHACSISFDARLLNTQDVEYAILDDLVARLDKRRRVFEKLLKKKLQKISNVYLSTWADGWGTFDTDSGTVEATTTLSVTYDIGGRVNLR